MALSQRSTNGESLDSTPPPDIVWIHSRREALMILVAVAVFLSWTVGTSYYQGYGENAATDLVLGIPAWVFWGIAVPWATAVVVSIVFAVWLIADDPLEMENPKNIDEDSIDV